MSICSVRGQHCLSRVKSLQMGEKEGRSLNSLLPHCLWLEVYMLSLKSITTRLLFLRLSENRLK